MVGGGELQSSEERAEAFLQQGKRSAAIKEAWQVLKEGMRGRARKEDVVATCGEMLLERARGSNRLDIVEQTALAASGVGKTSLAARCAEELVSKFPGSARAMRTKGMALEMENKLDDAEAVYNQAMEASPGDQRVLKRKAGLERSRNRPKKAIESLAAYLDTFGADDEAWAVLGHWYAELMKHSLAAFCFEELVLAQPQDADAHNRLAEACYTAGDFVKARRHFAAACELAKGHNLRCLYGLVACSWAQSSSENSSSGIASLAGAHLLNVYERSCPGKLPFVRALVGAPSQP